MCIYIFKVINSNVIFQSNLVQPIITPRFALSCDQTLMKFLGDLASSKKLHIQTHVSENLKEVDAVKAKYNMSYAQFYDSMGILTPKVNVTLLIFPLGPHK